MKVLFEDWTLAKVRKIARRYKFRVEWQKKHPISYGWASTHHLLDQCCGHMKALLHSWTYKEVRDIALQFPNKPTWKKASPNSYAWAQRHGEMGECSRHMNNRVVSYKLEDVKRIALKYKTRTQWAKGPDCGSYAWALQRRLLDQLCAHMPVLHQKWNETKVQSIARRYESRTQWARGADANSYAWALKKNLVDKLSNHMGPVKKYTDADMFYIYSTDKIFNRKRIYKFGVTSERRGMHRIEQVSRKLGSSFELIYFEKVKDAFEYEDAVSSLDGQIPDFGDRKVDGYSEMRAWSSHELKTVSKVVNKLLRKEVELIS
jgi:hypothetical protein